MPRLGHGASRPEHGSAVAASCPLRARRGIVLGREDLSSCVTRSEGVEDEVVDPYREEERRILLWRLAQFARLGFAYPESVVLAATGVDLGEARKLVACGCPAETASRILL
jgi:hypothetical protein